MKLLELTAESAEENLAIDEALLEFAETNDHSPEVLRLWEPTRPFVVIGRSSPLETEVNLPFCQKHSIAVLRRCSGGQTIVTGPGCLMYAVLLDYRKRPELRMLEVAHQFVMQKMQKALQQINIETKLNGTSDLTLNGKKFSGNALRCKRNWLIYHGTMLCQFDLDLIPNCLGTPIREPEYRAGRDHRTFLTQLPEEACNVAECIKQEWEAKEKLKNWPRELTNRLVAEKYSQEHWNGLVK